MPVEVKAICKYTIWIKYQDGSSGTIDLSDLAFKPVFLFWEEGNNFEKVFINQSTGAIAWNDEIELCPDSLYFEINNLSPESYIMKESF
ncbi:MAG: DUF2442 domain-containing protein [Bacteroidetes bacterium]|nr:DUF2442 domain-containing protein [Bacteroidota bacterium]